MATDSFYCPRCGAPFEPDCDFCTNCSAARPRAEQAYPPAPHQWMETSPPPRPQGRPQTYAAPPYQVAQPLQVIAVAAGPGDMLLSAPGAVAEKTSVAQISLVTSVVMLSLAVVALIPCLGWANWLNLLILAEVQHISWWVSFFGERGPKARGKRLLSLPFFLGAVFLSVGRLIIGGGCL
ncbi:MAG TPA: hypothetical protein VGV38_10785 [Pyrinomonadaceae bacterium]|nr:hypothetical protein [Pyrinomonadaceae bacterium]